MSKSISIADESRHANAVADAAIASPTPSTHGLPSSRPIPYEDPRRDIWLSQIEKQLDDPSTGLRSRVLDLVTQHLDRPGTPTGQYYVFCGSYNMNVSFVFYHEITGYQDYMFRVPIPGVVAFAEEKTRAEAAAISYIAAHTTIRVPRVYYRGTATENSTGLDLPFMIVEYIGHNYNMAELLAEPTLVQRPELNTKLIMQHLLQQFANIYIQLSELQSSSISALGIVNGQAVPDGAPRTSLLNNQFSLYHVPEAAFAPVIANGGNTISTSRQWHVAIANTYIAGLLYDRDHDPESDAEAIRSSFVARYLFRQLALKREFPLPEGSTNECFRFWCDDLRPHNVLCNEYGDVQGVIDWEWAYFAPESYIYDAPFWLGIDRFPDDILDSRNDNAAANKQPDTTRQKDDSKEVGEHKRAEGVPGADYSIAGSGRADFEFDDDIECMRKTFMHALRLEEQKLHKREGSQATLKRDDQQAALMTENSHIQIVAKQLSTLSMQDEDEPIPTPLYDRMTQRWEKQRNEFIWNFSHRWDRDEFDLWYWQELDREYGGPDSRDDYHQRLDLLPERVKDLMEWFVHKRIEEREKWDPVELMKAVLGQMDETGPFVTAVVDHLSRFPVQSRNKLWHHDPLTGMDISS